MVQSLYVLWCKSFKVDAYIRKYDETKYLALFYSDENIKEFLIELGISLY